MNNYFAPNPSNQKLSQRSTSAKILNEKFILFLLVLLLLFRALELRLPCIPSKTLTEAEARHSYFVMISSQIKDITGQMGGQAQPALDYILRKMFWFPVLGYHERSLKIPCVFYSLVTVILSTLFAFSFFKKQRLPKYLQLIFAFFVGLWVVNMGRELEVSADGRHYSLISLLSLLWFFVYFRDEKPKWQPLFWSSLLYANVHFFALAMIACGYGLEILYSLTKRKWKTSFTLAIAALTVFIFTKEFNFDAFHVLTNGDFDPSRYTFLEATREGWSLWIRYQEIFEFPVHWAILWVGIVGALIYGRYLKEPGVPRWLLIKNIVFAFVAMPLFFIYARLNSKYGFVGSRYFSPFFGVGYIALLFFLREITRLFSSILSHFSIQRRSNPIFRLLTASGLGLVCVLFGVPDLTMKLVPDWKKIPRISPEFSLYHKLYTEIKDEQAPILLIHPYCYLEEIPLYYLRFNGTPYYKGHEVVDTFGCAMPMPIAHKKIETFLKFNPLGVVVFEKQESDCSNEPVPKYKTPITIEKINSVPLCAWKVRGVHTIAEVRDLTKLLKLRYGETF